MVTSGAGALLADQGYTVLQLAFAITLALAAVLSLALNSLTRQAQRAAMYERI